MVNSIATMEILFRLTENEVSRFMTKTLDETLENRIVPVVVLEDSADAAPLAQALVNGGLPVAEVTFRTAAAPAAIEAMSASGNITVGAGTVLTPEQVDRAVDAGAKFIVSPGTSLAVVRRCQERGIPVLPGAVTATEIQAALECGLQIVKFFPAATSGGAAAIAALAAPFKNIRFVPTGGIGPANLTDYLALPSVSAVGGSWMVHPRMIAEKQFKKIEELTAEAVSLVKE